MRDFDEFRAKVDRDFRRARVWGCLASVVAVLLWVATLLVVAVLAWAVMRHYGVVTVDLPGFS